MTHGLDYTSSVSAAVVTLVVAVKNCLLVLVVVIGVAVIVFCLCFPLLD